MIIIIYLLFIAQTFPYCTIGWLFLDRFDSKKGFFCQITSSDKTKCLGKSKGRAYEPMDAQSEALLRTFYRKPNVALSKLLLKLEQTVPEWLEKELSDLRWLQEDGEEDTS